MASEVRHLLVVVRWPLGGIRTYMRYMFSHFPTDFRLTLLAASTQEDQAIIKDTQDYRARLVLVKAVSTASFTKAIFSELLQKRYDLIISQGFVSAVSVHFANLIVRVPHILTIHGIVEPQYLDGRLGFLKRRFLEFVLSKVTVLYGVSSDILEHLYQEFPRLHKNGPQSLVVLNGIELSDFDRMPDKPFNIRSTIGIEVDVFLFSFFGRFMPQKGFDLIIEAVELLQQKCPERRFAVVAVGSGDYIREYQISIHDKQLESLFHFLPFQPMVHHLYAQVDTILMPSRWEASGLLAMEALCSGVPLIASNCMGLRETTAGTPTYVFQSENIEDLVTVMARCLLNCDRDSFKKFTAEAMCRFDVTHSSNQLADYIRQLLNR